MKIPRRSDLQSLVSKIFEITNGYLELGENLRTVTVVFTAPGVANADFTVQHNLGKTPTIFIANLDRSGTVYVQSRTAWNSETMVVRCSVASAEIRMVVF